MGRAARAREINEATRDAGVTWHDCEGCGQPWPFPLGNTPPGGPPAVRDWRCHRCVQNFLGRVARATGSHIGAIPGALRKG